MITWLFETAIIFRREFSARRQLLLAGLAVSSLTLVLPLLPSFSSWHGGDVRDVLSIALAAGAGVVLSVGLGASLFGSDLSEGRLGFFFERPVFSASIWLGRFLAALVIIIGAELIILAPASLSRSQGLAVIEFLGAGWSFSTWQWVLALTAGPAFIFLVSHCVSIMLRARTAWLVLDLIGAVVLGPVMWLIHLPFVAEGAESAAGFVGSLLAVSMSVALLAAMAASVSCGRTDLRRAHRYLSVTLWGVLSVTLIATAAYSSWLLDIVPADFDSYRVLVASPDGKWIEVQGTRRGHHGVSRRYLVSSEGRAQISVPASEWWWPATRFSSTGDRAVWKGRGGKALPRAFWYVDLQSADIEPVETNITVSKYAGFQLSPEGSRVAVLDGQMLSVYELEDGRLVSTMRVPEDSFDSVVRFTNRDNIRYAVIEPVEVSPPEKSWAIRVSDNPVGSSVVATHHDAVSVGSDRWIRFDPDLRFIVNGFDWTRQETPARMNPHKVFDSITGEYKITVAGSFKGFLRDGRVWSTGETESGEFWVAVQSPDDGGSIEYNLGSFPGGFRIYEMSGGDLAIVSHVDKEKRDSWDTPWDRIEALDLETGDRRLIGEQLYLVDARGRDTSCTFESGYGWNLGYRAYLMFRDEKGVLLGWDSKRRQLRPIAGSGRK